MPRTTKSPECEYLRHVPGCDHRTPLGNPCYSGSQPSVTEDEYTADAGVMRVYERILRGGNSSAEATVHAIRSVSDVVLAISDEARQRERHVPRAIQREIRRMRTYKLLSAPPLGGVNHHQWTHDDWRDYAPPGDLSTHYPDGTIKLRPTSGFRAGSRGNGNSGSPAAARMRARRAKVAAEVAAKARQDALQAIINAPMDGMTFEERRAALDAS